MRKLVVTFAACLAYLAVQLVPGLIGSAAADPVGSYQVVGVNPDSGGQYRGTVTVSRTGANYKVVWKIGATTFVGTGLGATIRDGEFHIGDAEPNNSALSVGYVSGRTFGVAFYPRQADGSWQGVWTYGGSRQVSNETWYRK